MFLNFSGLFKLGGMLQLHVAARWRVERIIQVQKKKDKDQNKRHMVRDIWKGGIAVASRSIIGQQKVH